VHIYPKPEEPTSPFLLLLQRNHKALLDTGAVTGTTFNGTYIRERYYGCRYSTGSWEELLIKRFINSGTAISKLLRITPWANGCAELLLLM